MNAAQYYMRVRGRVQGPFDQERLQNLSRRGQLSRMHEVSTDGVTWARASTFPELFPAPATVPATAATTNTAAAAAPAPAAAPPNPPAFGATSTGRAEWWYSIHGQERGPFEFVVLERMAAGGELGRHDYVWKSGMPGWREATEIPGLTFAEVRATNGMLAGDGMLDGDHTLFTAATSLRRGALRLAILICLAAGACCLWSLWQFFGPAARQAGTHWSLVLGAVGLVESGLLAAMAIALSVHAGRLAGLRHSPEPIVLEKALAALRPFWLLATLALVLGLALMALLLALLPSALPPDVV
jgi:hypothetical protein